MKEKSWGRLRRRESGTLQKSRRYKSRDLRNSPTRRLSDSPSISMGNSGMLRIHGSGDLRNASCTSTGLQETESIVFSQEEKDEYTQRPEERITLSVTKKKACLSKRDFPPEKGAVARRHEKEGSPLEERHTRPERKGHRPEERLTLTVMKEKARLSKRDMPLERGTAAPKRGSPPEAREIKDQRIKGEGELEKCGFATTFRYRKRAG